ncbi:hypothetical protein Mapa_009595 [Marchantia paleacea]|nr:hypothetical protein Mapa_009595 [Marchantia paleacea]
MNSNGLCPINRSIRLVPYDFYATRADCIISIHARTTAMAEASARPDHVYGLIIEAPEVPA